MGNMAVVLACLGLILALVLLVFLTNRSQRILEIPLMVGLLIGFAFAAVVGQIGVELTRLATPDLTKLIDAERQSREDDIKALGARLDELKTALSTLTTKLQSDEEARKKTITQLADTIKPLPDRIADHEARLKVLENPPVPPPSVVSPVTLASAQVEILPARGKPPTIRVHPQITVTPGAKIQWAEISFCPLSSDGGPCIPAPPTRRCGAHNLCEGQDGQYATVPQSIASKPQFCVQVKYTLHDNIEAILYGGPLIPKEGPPWHRDIVSSTPCEPKTNHPATPGA